MIHLALITRWHSDSHSLAGRESASEWHRPQVSKFSSAYGQLEVMETKL